MALSASTFVRMLKALLPQGAAWQLEPDSTLVKTLAAIANELIEELDPRTTSELLGDWERALALPTPCVTAAQTLNERRAAIVGVLNQAGGNSIAYFIALATSMGASITITEDHPFLIGLHGMGDEVGGEEWTFVWHVTAPAGLTAAQRQLLECTFKRIKPAHTLPTFQYV